MNKAKKIIISAAVMILAAVQGFSSGYPVFDAANWLSAIDRFYQGYDQIMNTLQMIEQNYQQIQQAIEQAKSWKFEDIDFNDGNLLENFDIRDEIKDATKQVNRQLNNIRKVRDTFEKENMTIGNKTFSMKDLAGLGDKDKTLIDIVRDSIEMEKNDFSAACEELVKELTPEEKQLIWQKYGLNPKNFAMVKNLDKQMQEQVTTVMANANAKVEELRMSEEAAKTNAIIKKIFDGEDLTEKELIQSQLLLEKLNGEKLSELQSALQNSFAWLAWKDRRDAQQKELELQQQAESRQKLLERDEGFINF